MSRLKVISVELEHGGRSSPQWADAPGTYIGGMAPADLELTRCTAIGDRIFSGRIEFAALDNAILSKITSTSCLLSRSGRLPERAIAGLVIAQVTGTCHIEQHHRSCTLHPGDWGVIDLPDPCELWLPTPRNESLVFALERTRDPERLRMIEQGAARRFTSNAGLSRILRGTLAETFDQTNRLSTSSRKSLQRALNEMAWSAMREQIDAPPSGLRRDVVCAPIKGYIEQRFADPELSVDSIAEACGISARTIHRAFKTDSVGLELYLGAPPKPLRGRPAGSQPSPSLNHRDLLFSRVQQQLAFQPSFQGAFRGHAARVSACIPKGLAA